MRKKLSHLPFWAVSFLASGLFLLFLFFFTVKFAYAALWGDANIGIYPVESSIVAPNGLVYNPLAHIRLNLNIGNDNLYLFDENVLFLERPTPGVTTNSNQGSFDFTKREMDLKIGLAAKPFDNKHFEFRLWGISLNNLNRGNDENRPSGFKDGIAAETRYYFSGEKVWGHLTGGYYFSKQLIAPNGEPYKPGIFMGGELNYDLLKAPQKMYAFTDIMVVNLFGRFEGGLAYRPLRDIPDMEVRLSGSKYLTLNEKTPGETTGLFEIRYYFTTAKASSIRPDYANNRSEPISKEAIAYKTATGHLANKPLTEPIATDVWFDSKMMYVRLLDGRQIGVPLEWFPKLRDAQDGQRRRWRLAGSGIGIYWEDLDEDISVAEFLK